MNKGFIINLFLIFVLSFLFTSTYCGGGSTPSSAPGNYGEAKVSAYVGGGGYDQAMPVDYMEEGAYRDYAESAAQSTGVAIPKTSNDPQIQKPDRLIVYSAYLRLEIHTSDQIVDSATEIAEKYEGYIANASDTRIVVKILANHFDDALLELQELGRILDKRVSAQDVTEAFMDLKTRIENLKLVKKQLEQLIARTTKIEDLIYLEKQLHEVSLQITNMEEQLRSLSNAISYSTIEIDLVKVAQQTEYVIKDNYFGFVNNLGIGRIKN